MKQANPLEPNIAKVDNVDKQFFEMGLEINAPIKSLATLTIYNQQLANAIDSLTFSAALHMQNNIRHAKNNSKSSTFYCYFTQSNLHLGHIQGDIGLINNINNETTTLWQIIVKVSASTMSDADTKVRDNIIGTYYSIQLYST